MRNMLLSGVMPQLLFAPDDGAGAGGAAGGAAAAAGTRDAGAGGAAGAGQSGGQAGAAAGAAGGAGTGGDPGAAAATLAGGGSDPTKAALQAPGKFPDNWRELIAGDDKTALKDLAKYTDPNAPYKALRQLQNDISTGKMIIKPEPLDPKATDEQKAEYRKTHNLPDSPEAYIKGLALPDGIVVGEADKPLVTEFAKDMFEAGASQAEMNRAMASYYRLQNVAAAERAEADGAHKHAATEALMTEWGPGDYKTNMNAVATLQSKMAPEFLNTLLSARTEDGRMVGNTPEYLRWAAATARELFPQATVISASDPNPGKSIGEEISAIEGKMYKDGQPNPEYWRGEAGARLQARYRELIDTREKMAARGKAA